MTWSSLKLWFTNLPVGYERPWWLLSAAALILAFAVSARSVAGIPRWHRRLALGLRLVVLSLVCSALAGMSLLRAQDSLCVLFLVDASRSVSEDQRELAMSLIREATQNMRRGKDQVGTIVFAEEASLETAPSYSPQVGKIESITGPEYTNIAAAIRLALASFSEGSGKRIVLLSDGNETLGRAIDEARVALANNAPVDVVPLRTPYTNEACLESVLAPQRVKVGEPFEIRIVLTALARGSGTLVVHRNRQLFGEREVKFGPGKNVYRLRQSIEEAGLCTYDIVLVSEDDELVENNRAMGFTYVEGEPRVLYCTADITSDGALPEALAKGHMNVATAGPSGVPAAMADIIQYDAVIFSSIPATVMRTEQMEMIRAACRDLGIGFAMVGGEDSFGLGGYYKTPIEDTLPVSMDITHKKHFPSTSLVICVDTSGSMGVITGGRQKIDIANEAACLTAELLTSRDELAVVSVDTWAADVLPLSKVDDVSLIKQKIRTMRAGGGGIYVRTALRRAYDILLNQATGQIRHAIVLADGADSEQQEGCVELARDALSQHGVTTTVISLGNDIHTPFLRTVAAAGGGRLYIAEKMEDVPRIYTKETMIVARAPVIEEPFYPAVDAGAPPLKGIDWGSAPPLLGYVGTTEKPPSQVFMRTHKDDPLLASWQFGLGRSVAFASDAKARWSAEWLEWPGYPKFWQQVVRWILRATQEGALESTVQIERGQGTITVEALGPEDEFLNYLDIRARLVTPDNQGHDLRLDQVAPGRYQQRFATRDVGCYMVNITYQLPDGQQVAQTAGAVVPYPEEFRQLTTDEFMLGRIAEASGGQVLEPEEVIGVYQRAREAIRAPTPIWPALLLAALIMFPFDIAVRRLVLDRRHWEAVQERLAEFRARLRQAREPEVTVDPTLGRLLVRRRRDATPDMARLPSQAVSEPAQTTPADTARLQAELREALARKAAAADSAATASAVQAPAPGDGDTFSRLIAAKKRARGAPGT